MCGDHGSQKDKHEQLKQVHAAQIRALQDEHQRQQEELLQVRQWAWIIGNIRSIIRFCEDDKPNNRIKGNVKSE